MKFVVFLVLVLLPTFMALEAQPAPASQGNLDAEPDQNAASTTQEQQEWQDRNLKQIQNQMDQHEECRSMKCGIWFTYAYDKCSHAENEMGTDQKLNMQCLMALQKSEHNCEGCLCAIGHMTDPSLNC